MPQFFDSVSQKMEEFTAIMDAILQEADVSEQYSELARYIENFLLVVSDLQAPHYTHRYRDDSWFDYWGAEFYGLCHEKCANQQTFVTIKRLAEQFIKNKYFSHDDAGYHSLMSTVIKNIGITRDSPYPGVSSIINPTQSVTEPMKSEVRMANPPAESRKSSGINPTNISAHSAPPPPPISSQALYSPAEPRDARLDFEWNQFLIRLLKCVTRNERGEITGIDVVARKKVIRDSLTEDLKFPEYIRQHSRQAGNVVVTMPTQVKSREPNPVRQRLENTSVLQSLRFNMAGQLTGSGLYGGFNNETTDREAAARSNFKTKLSLSKKKGGCEEYLERTFDSSNEALAYSVNDAAFFTEKFQPTIAYVEKYAREIADPTIVDFYKKLAIGKQPFELFDDKSLKLATSNTYNIPLDARKSQELMQYIDTDKISEPYMYVKYKADVKPLIDCLFPKDYVYRHEFYVGILPILVSTLDNDETAVTEALEHATMRIIDRLLSEITQRFLANDFYQDKSPEEIYAHLQSLSAINIQDFMRQYPGLGWETMPSVLKLEASSIMRIDKSTQICWSARKNEIINHIASTQQALQRAGITIAHKAETRRSTLSANLELHTAEINALEGLISSIISLDERGDKMPLCACDCVFYTQDEYNDLNPKVSIITRDRLDTDPLFAYVLLRNLNSKYHAGETFMTPDALRALHALSIDMITGEIMTDPYIAYVKYNGKKQMVVCNKTTLGEIELRGAKISHKREFSELGSVLELMRSSLADLPSPTVSRLSTSHNWFENLITGLAEIMPEHKPPTSASTSGFFTPGLYRGATQAFGIARDTPPPPAPIHRPIRREETRSGG